MELKCDLFQLERKGCNAFNRTAYGIEIRHRAGTDQPTLLLIAPLMELKLCSPCLLPDQCQCF